MREAPPGGTEADDPAGVAPRTLAERVAEQDAVKLSGAAAATVAVARAEEQRQPVDRADNERGDDPRLHPVGPGDYLDQEGGEEEVALRHNPDDRRSRPYGLAPVVPPSLACGLSCMLCMYDKYTAELSKAEYSGAKPCRAEPSLD